MARAMAANAGAVLGPDGEEDTFGTSPTSVSMEPSHISSMEPDHASISVSIINNYHVFEQVWIEKLILFASQHRSAGFVARKMPASFDREFGLGKFQERQLCAGCHPACTKGEGSEGHQNDESDNDWKHRASKSCGISCDQLTPIWDVMPEHWRKWGAYNHGSLLGWGARYLCWGRDRRARRGWRWLNCWVMRTWCCWSVFDFITHGDYLS